MRLSTGPSEEKAASDEGAGAGAAAVAIVGNEFKSNRTAETPPLDWGGGGEFLGAAEDGESRF